MYNSPQTSDCVTNAMFMAAESYSASSYGDFDAEDEDCEEVEERIFA